MPSADEQFDVEPSAATGVVLFDEMLRWFRMLAAADQRAPQLHHAQPAGARRSMSLVCLYLSQLVLGVRERCRLCEQLRLEGTQGAHEGWVGLHNRPTRPRERERFVDSNLVCRRGSD